LKDFPVMTAFLGEPCTRFSPVAGILLFESIRHLTDATSPLAVSVPLPGFFYLKARKIRLAIAGTTCFSPVAGILLFESSWKLSALAEQGSRFSPVAGILLFESLKSLTGRRWLNFEFQSRCRDSFI